VHRLEDGGCAVQALAPLGRLTPEQALALAGLADEVRITPWRTVVIRDVADPGEVRRRLEAAGLVTDPDSPWQGVTACSGLPGCAKSHADVRADATAWVLARRTAPDIPVHWSGCERRCGLPRGRVRQLVATPHGYLEGIS
jgi:precorrin-3B synthase